MELNTEHAEWGKSLFTALIRLLQMEEPSARWARFRQFHLYLIDQLSDAEGLIFHSAFSRISYIATHYGLPGRVSYTLHHYRKWQSDPQAVQDPEQAQSAAVWATAQVIGHIWKLNVPVELLKYQPLELPPPRQRAAYHNLVRVILLSYDERNQSVTILREDLPQRRVLLRLDHPALTENYIRLCARLEKEKLYPLEAQLLKVDIMADGDCRPEIIIIEPDYLIDVTAVAACFKDFGIFTADAVVNRFLDRPLNLPILIGSAVNYILDRLIKDPRASFDTLFKEVFQLSPMAYARLQDRDIMEIMSRCRSQYHHLREVIDIQFSEMGIDREQCILEPSFYSPVYGIQGRLDVLHRSRQGAQIDIIELKSGAPWRPNVYGLSDSHYVQTLLYDVLIQSSTTGTIRPSCYILYSRLEDHRMRHAPYVETKVQEAVLARNYLVLQERRLARGGLMEYVRLCKPGRFPQISGYLKDNLANFYSLIEGLDRLEKLYVTEFSAFIAREHQMAKLGDSLGDRHGLAGLWKHSIEEKLEQFSIIRGLEYIDHDAQAAVLSLRRTRPEELSSFRKGDIVLIYSPDHQQEALSAQMLKGSIISIDRERVDIRLRSTPLDRDAWTAVPYWNIERDLIDAQYYQLYNSLLSWSASTASIRSLWLGRRAPQSAESVSEDLAPYGLNAEQEDILRQLIAAPEYFLLWGPPGTGKTSRMLRSAVDYLIRRTDENILLIAFTNRAVDEICDQLVSIDHPAAQAFIRIGSRYATSPEHTDRLLVRRMETIHTRADLRELFTETRVVVSTLSSVSSRPELLDLISFDRLIVDEASQILEAHIVGLLSRIPRSILIGDHKQLPAVSQQPDRLTALRADHPLRSVGIEDTSCSLFERLFERARAEGWSHAYAMLSLQGRMHQSIMRFVSDRFYDSALEAIHHDPQIAARISRVSPVHEGPAEDSLSVLLSSQRLIYLESAPDYAAPNYKMNRPEAELVAQVLQRLDRFDHIAMKSIGIITPFRAQIATLLEYIPSLDNIDTELITVDTVERYQGSARDIIIISTACNHIRQLHMISSMHQGIDRKLNVAITRAREQVILIGNKEVLSASEAYRAYIQSAASSI